MLPHFSIIMKKASFLLLIALGIQIVHAQEIALSNLNSSNILDYYSIMERGAASSSTTLTEQYGDNNHIEILDVNLLYLRVTQIGENNTTVFTNSNATSTNAEIRIHGSNNYIDIAGSNSISDGMKMNINANDMTILMRNN